MLSYLGPIRTPKSLYMKKTFTKKTKFLSGVLTLKKKIALLLIMVIMGTGSLLHAQTTHYSGFVYDSLGFDLDGLHTVFVSITPINTSGGAYNSDFTLRLKTYVNLHITYMLHYLLKMRISNLIQTI